MTNKENLTSAKLMSQIQVEAFERVCQKNYIRHILNGSTEKESLKKVLAYIDDWISKHGKIERSDKRLFALNLRKKYEFI